MMQLPKQNKQTQTKTSKHKQEEKKAKKKQKKKTAKAKQINNQTANQQTHKTIKSQYKQSLHPLPMHMLMQERKYSSSGHHEHQNLACICIPYWAKSKLPVLLLDIFLCHIVCPDIPMIKGQTLRYAFYILRVMQESIQDILP